MSAKKKRYPARVGWIGWNDGNRFHWKKREDGHQVRVRVTAARDLTAEKAVEKVFANMADLYAVTAEGLNRFLVGTGMTATIDDNGKVKVWRVKR